MHDTKGELSVLAKVRSQRVIAIVRSDTAAEALEVGQYFIDHGLLCVEVSFTTPDAAVVISELRQYVAHHKESAASVGAGTVLDVQTLERALNAGAEFILAPNFSRAVVEASRASQVDVIPGVATPTEALDAIARGATMVKIFPATLWSPECLRDVLTALPSLETVVTGGVRLTSAPEWIAAGATAVGMGGSLARRAHDADTTMGTFLRQLASAR